MTFAVILGLLEESEEGLVFGEVVDGEVADLDEFLVFWTSVHVLGVFLASGQLDFETLAADGVATLVEYLGNAEAVFVHEVALGTD